MALFAPALCQYLMHDFSVHIRQSHVAPRPSVGQFFVINTQQVQHGRMQIVYFDLVFDRLVTVFIGSPMHRATSNAAARQPKTEAEWIMVTPVTSLGEGRPAEFARPDDERVVVTGL